MKQPLLLEEIDFAFIDAASDSYSELGDYGETAQLMAQPVSLSL